MRANTEEFLYLLLWTTEIFTRPTLHNLTDSFEGWTYRKGLRRRLEYLEKQKFIQRQSNSSGEHLYHLTDTGRLHALGGRDPIAKWNRKWDGKWRLVVFDLPEENSATRVRLRRFLRTKGFGFLQNSVWISPDPLDGVMKELSQINENVETLAAFDAQPACHFQDSVIVAGAWDFTEINRRYALSLDMLDKLAMLTSKPIENGKLTLLVKQVHHAWTSAMAIDPILPERLLPAGYLGKVVWQKRAEVWSQSAQSIQEGDKNFVPIGTKFL